MKKTTMAAAGVALAALAYLPPVQAQAQAQEYPSRSIRIILPFSPGAGTDHRDQARSDSFGSFDAKSSG